MKKWLIMLILLIPFKVDAIYCSNSELANLKRLAANVNYSYDYIEENNSVIFNITLTNLQPNFYIVDKTTNIRYENSPEHTFSNYKSGQIVRYQINSKIGNCSDEILHTISISLPTYNLFYKDPLCEKVPDYKLCQKWSSHGLNYENFQKNILSYLKSLDGSTGESEIIENISIWKIILKLWLEYYYIPLGLIIIGSGAGIYVINKKSNIYN